MITRADIGKKLRMPDRSQYAGRQGCIVSISGPYVVVYIDTGHLGIIDVGNNEPDLYPEPEKIPG